MTIIGLSPNGEAATSSAEVAQVVLAATLRGVVRLERNGQSWKVGETTLADHQIAATLCDVASGVIVVAAYRPAGIFVSHDGGHTWSENRLQVDDVRLFSLSAQQTDRGLSIFAGTEPARVYRSDDLGDSWTELPAIREMQTDHWIFPTPPRYAHVKHVGSPPSDPATLYVSIEQGALLKSNDGGASWVEVEAFLSPEDRFHSDIHRVVISPADEGHLFMPTGEGFYRSLDGGGSWEHVLRGDARIAYPDPLFVDPTNHARLFMAGAGSFPGGWGEGPEGTADPAVMRSDDEGATWTEVMNGLPSPILGNIEAMSLHEASGVVELFLGTTQGEVYVSEDAGASWRLVAAGLPPISKSLHYRRFLPEAERAEVEARLKLEMAAMSAPR